jgi:hypothetical protein
VKKAKAEANMSARQADLEKKEKDKETTRVEAGRRRQERARSRRGDGEGASQCGTPIISSDFPAEAEAVEDNASKPTPSTKVSPPPPSSQPPSPVAAEKATVKRPPGKKPGKKLGNNQYTKAKWEAAAVASSPHGRKKVVNQVAGSGDEASENLTNGDSNGTGKLSPSAAETGPGPGKGKFGRGKKGAVNGNGTKAPDNEPLDRTFANMQAALVNMSAFVDKNKPDLETLRYDAESGPRVGGMSLPTSGGAVQPTAHDKAQQQGPSRPEQATSTPFRDDLSAYEMGLQLQRNIEAWQREWGHLAGSAVNAST